MEIIYRGKSLEKGEWIYGFLLYRSGRITLPGHLISPAWLIYNSDIGTAVEINSETIGQFINRIDVTKMKIFAGDIVNVSDDAEYFPLKEDGGENFVVKWWNEMCGFWLWHIESKKWWSGGFNPFSYLADDEIEVIGNETDNPELIGE